jgi:hypothetical protein
LNKLGTFNMEQIGAGKKDPKKENPIAAFFKSQRKNNDQFEENLLKLVSPTPLRRSGHVCVCVSVCVRVCARACACTCACVRERGAEEKGVFRVIGSFKRSRRSIPHTRTCAHNVGEREGKTPPPPPLLLPPNTHARAGERSPKGGGGGITHTCMHTYKHSKWEDPGSGAERRGTLVAVDRLRG